MREVRNHDIAITAKDHRSRCFGEPPWLTASQALERGSRLTFQDDEVLLRYQRRDLGCHI
ncbi:hypothetical protein GCM10020216_039250 [Nonomuraea helvata]